MNVRIVRKLRSSRNLDDVIQDAGTTEGAEVVLDNQRELPQPECMLLTERRDGNQKAAGNTRTVNDREEVAGWFLSLEMELPTRVYID